MVFRFEIGLKFAISAEGRLGVFTIGIIRVNLKSEGKSSVSKEIFAKFDIMREKDLGHRLMSDEGKQSVDDCLMSVLLIRVRTSSGVVKGNSARVLWVAGKFLSIMKGSRVRVERREMHLDSNSSILEEKKAEKAAGE